MNAPAQAVAPVAASEQHLALSKELEILKPEIAKVLPEHVSADKFMRVVATAIAQSPDLRGADRSSLFTSCVKCATDGLVPDGREAALVIFNTKEKFRDGDRERERWVKKVQYMPMVGGILKKIRNSGELLSLGSNVVHEQDTFRYWIDDAGEHLTFEPNMTVADRGKPTCAYAIAKTKDGGVYVEVMSRSQIEQVRQVSKAKDNGPWVSWWGEMARKTVIRRLSKRLPMSTDLEAVIHRDDELYELDKPRRATAASGTDAAKALLGLPVLPDATDTVDESPDASLPPGEGTAVDTDTGEVVDVSAKPLPEGFDVAGEEKALRSAKTLTALMKQWTEINKRLDGALMPNELHAAYSEKLDGFEAAK